MGGFAFSRYEESQSTFISGNQIKSSYLICYESLFGGFVREFSKKGAQVLFIGLNESWYKNLQGAKQFLYISSIRAIENRRSIARSSNDGVSAFINQKGDIISSIEKFSPNASINKIRLNNKKTFYTHYGDYLGMISFIILMIVILKTLLESIFKFKQ